MTFRNPSIVISFSIDVLKAIAYLFIARIFIFFLFKYITTSTFDLQHTQHSFFLLIFFKHILQGITSGSTFGYLKTKCVTYFALPSDKTSMYREMYLHMYVIMYLNELHSKFVCVYLTFSIKFRNWNVYLIHWLR